MLIQQSVESLWLRGEIERRGYAEFEHGIPPEIIDNLADKYADFTVNLPDPEFATMDAMLGPTPDDTEKIKLDALDRSKDAQYEWHKYRTNVPGVGKPDGYTNRSLQINTLEVIRGISLKDDPKEYYHYTPAQLPNMLRLHEEFNWGHIPPEVWELNAAFQPIHDKAAELILRVCGLIEETHPDIRKIITTESLFTSPLRFLGYHIVEDKPNLELIHIIAEGHYDKSDLTAQIAESHRGLQIATDKDAPLTDVERDQTKAVVFPSLGIQNHIDINTPYKAAWHEVIADQRPNSGRVIPPKLATRIVRYALVYFAQCVNYVDPGKAATHYR